MKIRLRLRYEFAQRLRIAVESLWVIGSDELQQEIVLSPRLAKQAQEVAPAPRAFCQGPPVGRLAKSPVKNVDIAHRSQKLEH